MGIVKLRDPQLIRWVRQCCSASNAVCHLAKVISSTCREQMRSFEIQAPGRVRDQCEQRGVGIWFHWTLLLDRWWEIQNSKWGGLTVSRAQLGQSKCLAMFSFTSSWALQCSALLPDEILVSLLLVWLFSNPVVIKGLHCLVLQDREALLSSVFCPPFLKVNSPPAASQAAALWQKITYSPGQSEFPFPVSWLPL